MQVYFYLKCPRCGMHHWEVRPEAACGAEKQREYLQAFEICNRCYALARVQRLTELRTQA
jgi:hypothetical protein